MNTMEENVCKVLQRASATHQDSGAQASVCYSAEHLLFIFPAEQSSSASKDSCKSMVLLQGCIR